MLNRVAHRLTSSGLGYSVVNIRDVSHVYASAKPSQGTTLQAQTIDALRIIEGIMESEGAQGSVVHQAVFLSDLKWVSPCRQIIQNYYRHNLPATNYVIQPPCDGTFLSIEAVGLGVGREKVDIQRINDRVVVTKSEGAAYVYADYALPTTSATGVYEKTICSYQQLRRLLAQGGARLDQVFRLWLSLDGIVDAEGPTQRYKEMNRARSDVYQCTSFLSDQLHASCSGRAFPASTGIGTQGRSINLSAIALVSENDDLIATPLENPRQTAAYSYAPVYSPTSPKFSRALALSQGAETTFYISGTASIINSETRHQGDAAAQTHETIDNISALISEDNAQRHGLPCRGATLRDLAVARIYIKRPEDYETVRTICEQRLGKMPASFVIADVCRPDLLVEIEAIGYSRIPDGASVAVLRTSNRSISEHTSCVESESGKRVPYCPSTCPERHQCPYAVVPAMVQGG